RDCFANHRTQLVHHLAMVANEEGIAAKVIEHGSSTIWRWWLTQGGIAAQIIEHSSSTIWRWWLPKKGLLRKSSNTARPPSGDGG
ncbi:MAG: hypothetical protein ACK56G_10600, partial [Pirellulaceae bacterium]